MNQPTERVSKDILIALVSFLPWTVTPTLLADGNFNPAPAIAAETSPKTIEILRAPSAAVARGGAPAVQSTSTGHSPVRDHLQQASPAN